MPTTTIMYMNHNMNHNRTLITGFLEKDSTSFSFLVCSEVEVVACTRKICVHM